MGGQEDEYLGDYIAEVMRQVAKADQGTWSRKYRVKFSDLQERNRQVEDRKRLKEMRQQRKMAGSGLEGRKKLYASGGSLGLLQDFRGSDDVEDSLEPTDVRALVDFIRGLSPAKEKKALRIAWVCFCAFVPLLSF